MTASEKVKDFKKWLKQRNKKPKQRQCQPKRPRQSLIKQQILDYFEDHDTGTNAEIAIALGYRGGSNVSTMTVKMSLEGELMAEFLPNPAGGKAHRVYRKA